MDVDEHTDDMSLFLQLQQFLDEWYYRVLHSGLANDWDRERCAAAALDLFQLQGAKLTAEDKEELAKKEDDEMIECVVSKMPGDVRKAFEHFALQMQLVMSAASRVRCALEEGPPEELARIMEDGDQGVNSQILKQAIIEATFEVRECREVHESWVSSTGKRIARLNQCQIETERAKALLDLMNDRLGNFSQEQSKKAKGVLLSMAGNNAKTLMTSVFKAWFRWKVQYVAEKDIHEKFQKEIDDAQKKLMEYKQAQVENVRNVLMRNSEGSAKLLLGECVRLWAKDVQDEKDERELRGQMDSAKAKMGNLKAAQRDNAKKSMMRIASGNEESLKTMCMQAWMKAWDEAKRNKGFEEQVKAQEARMQKFMQEKSSKAQGVLSKMAGSSDTGVIHMTFSAWSEDVKATKKAKEVEELITSQNSKFANLNARMKDNANTTVARASELEDEGTLQAIFMNWATEAKLSRVIRHYADQMDSKKQQLEAVQSMFATFAQKLEQGMSSTPRTTHKNRSSSRPERSDRQSRPPLPAS